MRKIAIVCIVFAAFAAACGQESSMDTDGIGDLQRNLEIVVARPTGRAIQVDEFDIDSLDIRVRPAASQDYILTEQWFATQGPAVYRVSGAAGAYVLEVRHNGSNNGETVSVDESAAFSLSAMKITRVTVTPGAIGQIVVIGSTTNANPTNFTSISLTIQWTNVPTMATNWNGTNWYIYNGNARITGSETWMHTDGISTWMPETGYPVTVDNSNRTASVTLTTPVQDYSNVMFKMVSPYGWSNGCEGESNHVITVNPYQPVQTVTVPFLYYF
jgi:hypothetical protein